MMVEYLKWAYTKTMLMSRKWLERDVDNILWHFGGKDSFWPDWTEKLHGDADI